jgi:hypothetical protein
LDSRIILLVRNIVEDANVILSPQKSFVNVVECSSGLPGRKGMQRRNEQENKKGEEKEIVLGIV